MRLYNERFLPWIMEKVLSREVYAEQRRALLERAQGRVLELGFGFGGTIAEYPRDRVRELVALEPNPGMLRRSRPRIRRALFPVRPVRAVAETMPFRDASFDTVVSNWTLCSLHGLQDALREIRRVLAPGGLFLVLEHGLSTEPRLARWQRRLTPVQQIFAGGCRLDLDMEAVLRSGGFRFESFERYESEVPVRVLRQMYRVVARPC